MMKALVETRERFRQCVSELIFGRDMSDTQSPGLHIIADEVIVQRHMLHSGVEHWIRT